MMTLSAIPVSLLGASVAHEKRETEQRQLLMISLFSIPGGLLLLLISAVTRELARMERELAREELAREELVHRLALVESELAREELAQRLARIESEIARREIDRQRLEASLDPFGPQFQLTVAREELEVARREIDHQQFGTDPFGILLRLTEDLEKGLFPLIGYRDSLGIDTGGIGRDLITSLFAAIYPAVQAKPVLPDCNLASLKAYSPATRMRLHKAIGAIFGAAVLGHRDIVIGNRFRLVLFQMIGALSAEEIHRISDDCTGIPAEIVIKLFRMYVENIDDNHHIRSIYDDVMRLILANGDVDQILDISDELRDIYGYESEEPVTGRQLLADTFPALYPVCAIAKGMYTYMGHHVDDPDDDKREFVRSCSAMELRAIIEGTVSVQEVCRVLRTDEPNALAYQYLKKWVQEGTRLHDFLLCSTGAGTLPSGLHTMIDVGVHATDTERWVSFSTCSRTVYLPKVLQDTDEGYRRFTERLESSMSQALSGSGFSMM